MSRRRTPRLRHALALGLLHGPAELLPISSSGHVTLVPWLAGWEYAELDSELRKAFEVALHAGTAAALLVALRDEVREVTPRRLALVAGSFLPPAFVGYTLERPIERRLGTAPTIAGGLLIRSAALAGADPSRPAGPRGAGGGGGGPGRRGRPRPRPGGIAHARRLAQRRDAGRRPPARVR